MFTILFLSLFLSPVEYRADADHESKPIAVFCHADWCNPCKKMQEEMKKVRNMTLVDYYELDVDQEPERFNRIKEGNSIPQLIIYYRQDGKQKKKVHHGFKNAKQIEDIFNDAHLQSLHEGN